MARHPEGVITAVESVQPDTLRPKAPEEALDHSVLLGRVRGDVLLLELPPVRHRDKRLRAEGESVVTAQRETGAVLLDLPFAQLILECCGGDLQESYV